MNGEILSIETAQRIAKFEKENKKYEKIICKFDSEVNRQFNIIKEAISFIEEHSCGNLKVTFGAELLKILNKVYEEQDAKTISS